MRITIAIIAIALAVTDSSAGTKAGVTMPDTITVAGKSLDLNGMGLREATVFDIDVYVAGLYVEHVSSDATELATSKQVKRLVLRFVRKVSRSDILDAWHKGFAGNATVPLKTLKGRTDRLDSWMTGFAKGDTLTFTYAPGDGVRVAINGTEKGAIAGDDFASSLFSIWLGPEPPTKDLKRGLLGNHGARS